MSHSKIDRTDGQEAHDILRDMQNTAIEASGHAPKHVGKDGPSRFNEPSPPVENTARKASQFETDTGLGNKPSDEPSPEQRQRDFNRSIAKGLAKEGQNQGITPPKDNSGAGFDFLVSLFKVNRAGVNEIGNVPVRSLIKLFELMKASLPAGASQDGYEMAIKLLTAVSSIVDMVGNLFSYLLLSGAKNMSPSQDHIKALDGLLETLGKPGQKDEDIEKAINKAMKEIQDAYNKKPGESKSAEPAKPAPKPAPAAPAKMQAGMSSAEAAALQMRSAAAAQEIALPGDVSNLGRD